MLDYRTYHILPRPANDIRCKPKLGLVRSHLMEGVLGVEDEESIV